MNFNTKDIAIDKVKLIFEYKNSSPLFCCAAAYEVDSGNYLKAIELLEAGIKNFPNYATAYLVYSIALANTGNVFKAKDNAAKGARLLGSEKVLDYYNNAIDSIIKSAPKQPTVKGPKFVDEFEIDNNLDELASRLSNAKIKYSDDRDISTNGDYSDSYSASGIYSETLAEIFFAQKNYPESINHYKKLIEQKPQNAEKYFARINEIKSHIL